MRKEPFLSYRFSIVPATNLDVRTLIPNQSIEISLLLKYEGVMQISNPPNSNCKLMQIFKSR